MSPRTVFLSRLLGLYYILAALSMFLHKQTDVQTVTALIHNSPVMFVIGILTLLAGLAIVLAHNVWSGGARPVIVTLVAWITLAKALLFLFLSPDMQADFFLVSLHYDRFFYLYAGFLLVLGVYLAYGGFTSTSRT